VTEARTMVYGYGCTEILSTSFLSAGADDLGQSAIFFSEEGIAYDTSGSPLAFSFLSLSQPEVRERYGDDAQDIFRKRKAKARRLEGAPYIPALIPGYWNHYHFLIDCLPRVLLSLVPGGASSRILITQAQRHALERFCPGYLNAITHTFEISSRVDISSGELLYLPQAIIPRGANRFLREAMSEFRRVAKRLARPGVHRRIYISRSLAGARSVVNEPEVIDCLSKFGFEVLHLECLAIEQQIQAFSEAEIVVGPHGAGFANMVFAEPGITLLEFLPESALYKAPLFAELTAFAGCTNVVMRCKDAPNAKHPHRRGNVNMSVNCSDLLDLLAFYTRRRPQSTSARPRVLDLHMHGGVAERAMQYLTARHIAEKSEGCALSGVVLPEWGIENVVIEGEPDDSGIGVVGEWVNVDGIATTLRAGFKDRIGLRTQARWLSNFPDVEVSRSLLPANDKDVSGFQTEYLVAHIELPVDGDANRVLLPIDFYEELAQSTGLRLVFLGELDSSAYCRALRERFPDAVFQYASPTQIFHTLRHSVNLVPAVTSFSWLAAWLSRADRILLAVDGFLHPVQNPMIELLPENDSRYDFYLFPINYAASANGFDQAHAALRNRWRRLARSEIACLRTRHRPKRFENFAPHFDEDFYLRRYRDVAAAIAAGRFQDGLEHYRRCGFHEGRCGFSFDTQWYSVNYPQAAVDVGEGLYVDLRHHFVETGCLCGYKTRPSDSGASLALH
jgi:capsular polysaccharide biosynthesis protein